MAKILQIRRGTTSQNNNFTGMPGEITFDTEKKTIRVHDGATLGGYALLRAENNTDVIGESSGSTAEFDITSVPDTFWQSMLERMLPAFATYRDSVQMIISSVAYISYTFNIDTVPMAAQALLVCANDEAGYNTGDVVASFGIGNHLVPGVNVFSDSNGVQARLLVGSQAFWVYHKTTGVQTNITLDNWRIKIRIYC